MFRLQLKNCPKIVVTKQKRQISSNLQNNCRIRTQSRTPKSWPSSQWKSTILFNKISKEKDRSFSTLNISTLTQRWCYLNMFNRTAIHGNYVIRYSNLYGIFLYLSSEINKKNINREINLNNSEWFKNLNTLSAA